MSERARKAVMQTLGTWRVVKGDKVMVISGSNKGKVGTVLNVDRKYKTVVVEGLNLKTHHIKKQGDRPAVKFNKEGSIAYSNVMLVNSKNEPVHVSFKRIAETGETRRVTASGEIIEKPAPTKYSDRKFPDEGPKDTAPADVLNETYDASVEMPKLVAMKLDMLFNKALDQLLVQEKMEANGGMMPKAGTPKRYKKDWRYSTQFGKNGYPGFVAPEGWKPKIDASKMASAMNSLSA